MQEGVAILSAKYDVVVGQGQKMVEAIKEQG